MILISSKHLDHQVVAISELLLKFKPFEVQDMACIEVHDCILALSNLLVGALGGRRAQPGPPIAWENEFGVCTLT